MGKYFKAFKAYDVRGKVPDELNVDLAYRIGRAYADEVKPKTVCLGYDIRLSGPELCDALARGLNDAGVDVILLGLVGTEMVYFATAHYGYDGGVMITASHNPKEDNGLKMVRGESRPISGDTGLDEIEERAYQQNWERTGSGTQTKQDVYADFVQHLLGIVKPSDLAPLKVLCDAGNGASGVALEALLPHLPLQVERRLFAPDGNFPNGVPNPILEEQRAGTIRDLKAGTFDFGVAWDGDYDRCFFFDEHGNFIEGYYIAEDYQIGTREEQQRAVHLPAERLPAGMYLMMGDNRNNSFDGRGWGLVSRDRIVGRAEFVWWPISQAHRTH